MKELVSVTDIIKIVEKTIDYYTSIIKAPGMEQDDMKQEVKLRIFKAAKKYNPKYAVKTFFVPVIRNECLRLRKKQKKYYQNQFIVCKKKIEQNGITKIDNIIDVIDWQKITNDIKNILSNRDKIIFDDLLEGEKLKDIKEKVDLSFSTIHWVKTNTINKIAKKVIFENGYYI